MHTHIHIRTYQCVQQSASSRDRVWAPTICAAISAGPGLHHMRSRGCLWMSNVIQIMLACLRPPALRLKFGVLELHAGLRCGGGCQRLPKRRAACRCHPTATTTTKPRNHAAKRPPQSPTTLCMSRVHRTAHTCPLPPLQPLPDPVTLGAALRQGECRRPLRNCALPFQTRATKAASARRSEPSPSKSPPKQGGDSHSALPFHTRATKAASARRKLPSRSKSGSAGQS